MSSCNIYDWQDVYVACEKSKIEIGKLLAQAKNDSSMLHGNLFTFDFYEPSLNMVFIVPHKAELLAEGQMAIPMSAWLALDKEGEDGVEQVRQFLVSEGLAGIRVSLLTAHTTGQKKVLPLHLKHRVDKVKEEMELERQDNSVVLFN